MKILIFILSRMKMCQMKKSERVLKRKLKKDDHKWRRRNLKDDVTNIINMKILNLFINIKDFITGK